MVEKKSIKTRIAKDLEDKISRIIEEINGSSGIEMTQSKFFEMALKFFVKDIQKNGLTINLVPK